MPKILRLPEAPGAYPDAAVLVEDEAGELISQQAFVAEPAAHTAQGKRIGVRVAPADEIEELAPHLGKIALVAVEFPGPGDGRGFTYARLLRQRYGFRGEIRAVGAGVKQDLLFFMVRCGINTFELVATENLEEARRALRRFTLAYQAAVPHAGIAEPRFSAAHP